MLTNSRETYGTVAQALHWITAILILTLLPLGTYMHELPDSTAVEVAGKTWLYSLHKTLGVTVFFVAVVRILWALTQPHPKLLNAENKLESLAAQTVHWLLYGSIILVPVTGWLHHAAEVGFAPIWWPFGQGLPFVPKDPAIAGFFGLAHAIVTKLLFVSVMLHIVGALKHAFVDGDDTLKRMIPGVYRPDGRRLEDAPGKGLSAALATLAFVAVGGLTLGVYAFNGDDAAKPNLAKQEVSEAPSKATSNWVVDKEKSNLAIEVMQMGAAVSGKFDTWQAAINFDPENVATASVEVTIDTTSLTLGSVSDQAKSKDFLRVAEYPSAIFKSSDFRKTGENAYEATGELKLAGVTKPFTLPFTLKMEDGRAFMESETVIKRLDFDIGKTGFPDGGTAGLDVVVKVKLEAARKTNAGSS